MYVITKLPIRVLLDYSYPYHATSRCSKYGDHWLEGYRTPPEVTKSRLWSTLDNSGRTTGYTAILADNWPNRSGRLQRAYYRVHSYTRRQLSSTAAARKKQLTGDLGTPPGVPGVEPEYPEIEPEFAG